MRGETATQRAGGAWRWGVNPSLAGGIALILLWIGVAFVAHYPHGWPHLLFAAGVVLLIRRVVKGPDAW